MKYMDRVLFGCLALLLPISGFACTTAQWTSVSGGGAVTAASPPTFARYSELCALRVTNTGYVQDNSPDNHTTFIARFYVRPSLTGSGQVDLFVAYGAENGTLQRFKVSYDGANLDFHADGAQAGTVAAAGNLWHLVEVEYTSPGSTRFWVNSDATTAAPNGTFASASGSVESVRLGLPNGLGGFSASAATFDAYESHSSTPVGPLLRGDANADVDINILDFGFVRNEILGNSLAIGQPDCNRDGSIDILDFGCVRNIILGN